GRGLKKKSEPARDARRPHPPQILARRAAAALERAERRHEPGWSEPAGAGGSPFLPPLASPAAVDEARPDLPVADQRPERYRLRSLDEARPSIHRQLVALTRPEDPAADDPRRSLR